MYWWRVVRQPAWSRASSSAMRSSESRTPRSMPEAIIASRSSTAWKAVTVRASVLPSRLVSVERLHRDVARRALVLEGPHDALRRRVAVEDPVEPVLVALGVGVHEAPLAAVADVVLFDGHGQVARAEPLLQQLRLGVRAVHQVPWRVELAGHDDLRNAGLGGDLGLSHRLVPPCLTLTICQGRRLPVPLAAPRAARRAARGSRPRTAGSGPARWSPRAAARPPGG